VPLCNFLPGHSIISLEPQACNCSEVATSCSPLSNWIRDWVPHKHEFSKSYDKSVHRRGADK
jgi:hypothetical protein